MNARPLGLFNLMRLVLCGWAATAGAQAVYPNRAVRVIGPYAPGGTTNYAARQIVQKLTEQTQQSFFVENKTGASGTIGTDLVAKAAPDGSAVTNAAFKPGSQNLVMTESASGNVLVASLPAEGLGLSSHQVL